MRHIYLIPGFLLLSIFTNAQKLHSTEKKIIASVNKQMPETFALLEQLVNINSGTMNSAGVRQSGELVRKSFDKIGFATEWVAMPDSIRTAGHLTATIKGKKGKKILALAHLDTVFEPDMPANPYTIINDSTITGQGILDDKGGVIVLLAALQALHENGLLKDAIITVYLTGDEEIGGIPSAVTRADLIERAKQHTAGLSFEAGMINKVTTSRRGADTWNMYVYGTQAHSSGIFSEKAGYGAVYEAARILDSFRTTLGGEEYLTFNPGLIAGGTTLLDSTDNIHVFGKDNIIASKATVMGDLRFLGERQRREAREKMKSIVRTGNLAGTSATITFEDGMPSMAPAEGNNALLAEINKINSDMNLGTVTAYHPMERGAGDISFIADYLPCIDGLGPSGKGSHAPGETINSKELPILIQRTAIFIYRLTQMRE
ncbi:MAG: M20/M25/M40 family metallo-hydrolase [Chitinophagaceae bacterium]|nr:M20/M25/M40 family metallo-hydrolase [Chitinophagaceae bacterium]